MNNEVKDEVFRGHLDECLKHLSVQVPRSRRAQVKEPLANFCGVKADTASGWLYNAQAPRGEVLIKLMCYLDAIGYRVIEFEKMPKSRRGYVELVGFGFLTSSKAAELLGYRKVGVFYDVVYGRESTSKDKEQKMWGFWKKRREELEEKKKLLRERHNLEIPLRIYPEAESVKPEKTTMGRSAIISIMEGLLVLLEESSFSELPTGELAKLRQSATNIILRLSAHLSVLSSRLMMPNQQGDN